MPRYLTPAEIALIRPIFRHALDYAAIHIHGRRYLPLQNACTAMSPNGHSYYPRPLYRADFAHGTWQQRHLFIHECSHIWQHRLGYPVRRCGVCLARLHRPPRLPLPTPARQPARFGAVQHGAAGANHRRFFHAKAAIPTRRCRAQTRVATLFAQPRRCGFVAAQDEAVIVFTVLPIKNRMLEHSVCFFQTAYAIRGSLKIILSTEHHAAVGQNGLPCDVVRIGRR